MNLTLAYRGRSEVVSGPGGLAVSLAPNLRRDRVAFDASLRHPLRFREALGALHDVVVSDLRYKPQDRSAYEAYRADLARREAELRQTVSRQAGAAILKHVVGVDPAETAALEKRYRALRAHYWGARQKYSNYLTRHDPELWRLLVPC